MSFFDQALQPVLQSPHRHFAGQRGDDILQAYSARVAADDLHDRGQLFCGNRPGHPVFLFLRIGSMRN
jgi:hypothetical protein